MTNIEEQLGRVLEHSPASLIRFFPMPERDMTGCIAGWISEAE